MISLDKLHLDYLDITDLSKMIVFTENLCDTVQLPLQQKLPLSLKDFLGNIEKFTSRDLSFLLKKTEEELELNKYEIIEQFNQFHFIMKWRESSYPVFELTHSLMAALLLTNPISVEKSQVKLPFQTFIIKLPYQFWTMHSIDGNKKIRELVNVKHIIVQFIEQDGFPAVALRLISDKNKKGQSCLLENLSIWNDETSIKQILNFKSVPKNINTNSALGNKANPYTVPIEQEDNFLLSASLRLLINLCLYLQEKPPTNQKTKPLKIHNLCDFSKRPTYFNIKQWLIGKEIKLDKNLIQASKDWTNTFRKQTSQWRVSSRFTVRGHWRNQACGKDHKEHKLVWIEPFWKGPTEGIFVSHLYKNENLKK
jgi:hypothetical protein